MLLLTNCEVHTGKYSDRSFEVRTERSESPYIFIAAYNIIEKLTFLFSLVQITLHLVQRHIARFYRPYQNLGQILS